MSPATQIRAAQDAEVDEALVVLREAPNVWTRQGTRWSACWCTDGKHRPLDRSDFDDDFGGGLLAAQRLAERQRAMGLEVHGLRLTDLTAVIRTEVSL